MAIEQTTSDSSDSTCTILGAILHRTFKGSPKELLGRLARVGAFPVLPEALSPDLIGMDLANAPSLSWERLVALRRSRKLMRTFFRRLKEEGGENAYQALFEQRSPELGMFIAGVLIEKVLRLFYRSFPAFFSCAAAEAHSNLIILVYNACGEFDPDLLDQMTGLLA